MMEHVTESKPQSSDLLLVREETIEVEITELVEADLIEHRAFPSLRLSNAARITRRGCGRHVLNVATAKELVAYVETRVSVPQTRSARIAFYALKRNLKDALLHAEHPGAEPDSGPYEAMSRMPKSPVELIPGQLVYVKWDERKEDTYRVFGGLKVYAVQKSDGQYVDTNGIRVDYLLGYAVKKDDENQQIFARAGQVRHINEGRCGHLRRVV